MANDAATVDARTPASQPRVAPLREEDLPEAARIIRVAFGTFLGASDPENFWTDRDYAFGRHSAGHVASFGATLNGKFVGSNFAVNWGSVGFFGPLTVLPDLQEHGIARALLARTMEQFDAWGNRHVGLFTFAQNAKHVALYQKYGFYARFLAATMSGPARRTQAPDGWTRFSTLTKERQEEALRSCREATDSIYPGLDLTTEIRTTHAHGLGDTVLVEGTGGIAAFAVCHYGPKTEAGAGMCFIKFGAVRDSPASEQYFLRLIEACEALAAEIGMPKVLAGMNMGRHEAYRLLVARGYRAEI